MTQQKPQPHNDVLIAPQQNEVFQQKVQDDGQEHASKWALFAIVAIGIFMATLDSSIVNISLPSILSSQLARHCVVRLPHLVSW